MRLFSIGRWNLYLVTPRLHLLFLAYSSEVAGAALFLFVGVTHWKRDGWWNT